MSSATTMVNEAPHPTIRPYVQYQRLSIALFRSVNGFIRYLWYRRFFHCFINNIGDRFTWSTDGLIRSHPIGQWFNIIRFTPKVMVHIFHIVLLSLQHGHGFDLHQSQMHRQSKILVGIQSSSFYIILYICPRVGFQGF